MERWVNYFLASAGGSAALAGLVFVAVSLNLQKIISFKQLPDRALGSLILLVNIFTVSSFSLITVQSIQSLGVEILLLDIFVWFILTKKDVMNCRGPVVIGIGNGDIFSYSGHYPFVL
jgi:modulator of FtsH protease